MEEREKESKLAGLWEEAKDSSRINAGTVLATPVIFVEYLIKYAYESMRDFFYSTIR
jgi:hypothetical protein